MLQKVNGAKLMVMVRECPGYEVIEQAAREGLPVVLETASYANCVESVGAFELVDIRKVHRTKDGFRFNGSIVGVDVDAHPEFGDKSIIYVKSGAAKVVVDAYGANLYFLINLSLHIA